MNETRLDSGCSAPARMDGQRLSLRLVTLADAEYIHGLRTNPLYNTYLSAVSGTAVDQRSWIERYKLREADGQEYYYVIQCRDGPSCGVVRLYDIVGNQFAWGSWILDESKPAKAALESAFLSFSLAFDHLGLSVGLIDVRKENAKAIAFYRRFGMVEVRQNDQNIYFELHRGVFEREREKHILSIGLQE